MPKVERHQARTRRSSGLRARLNSLLIKGDYLYLRKITAVL